MSRRSTIRAVVETVVPHASDLDEHAWSDVLAIIDRVVAERPARLRRQLSLFIRVVEYAPVLLRGRRFTRLSADDRVRCLLRFQDSTVLLLRRGLWGLRTLAFMGYYGRADAAAAIGYAASAGGWETHRGRRAGMGGG